MDEIDNLNNDESGVTPLSYDKSKYTDEQETHYCRCCGYRTIKGYLTFFGYNKPPHTYAICRICFWQDDGILGINETSGANHITLRQGQRNFQKFGASKRDMLSYVEKPTDQDERDPNWQPL